MMSMSRRSQFVDLVIEQMACIGKPQIRAMFGGYGIYQGDRIFAIIVDDRLYFKVDAATRGEFEAQGLHPFTYLARGKSVTMQYFEAPPEVFEGPEAMRIWVQKALGVATKKSRIAQKPRDLKTTRAA